MKVMLYILPALLLLMFLPAYGVSGHDRSVLPESYQISPVLNSSAVDYGTRYKSVNRNRRLAQTMEQYNNSSAITWVDRVRSDYVYNLANPSQADTIKQYDYYSSSNTWSPKYNVVNTWDDSWEYLLSQTWNPLTSIVALAYTRVYDDQNRLTLTYGYEMYDNTWINSLRYYYFYTGSNLTGRLIYVNDYLEGILYYYRYTFDCDPIGRITDSYFYISHDSLNWQNYMRYHYTYSPDDVSTGEGMINNISHYTTPFYICGSTDYGKMTEITGEVFEQNNWNWAERTLFTYENGDTRITATEQTYYLDMWINTRKTISCYDADNQLASVESAVWNPMYPLGWMPPNTRTLYTWENTTGAEDETIAPLKLCTAPNPFNTSTSISILGKEDIPTKAEIYNLKGQLVKSLGSFQGSIVWDGKDNRGIDVPTGIYLVKANQDGNPAFRKVFRVR